MTAVVVGGGIGGLAVARLLARARADVVLVEQALGWAPVGAGIMLSANALAVLDHMGVGAAVRAAGRTACTGLIADERGRPLAHVSLGPAELQGPELVAVHRSALHERLLDGLDVDARLGTTVTALELFGGRVRAQLSDGSALEADVVVGADGLRSGVRGLLLGRAAPAVRYAGYTCWRVVTRDRGGARQPVEQWGRGQRVGVVPLVDGMVYAFLTETAPPGGQGTETPADLRRRFAGFGGAAGRLLDSLPADAPVLHHDIEELSRPTFGAGRVALLGDAAHAMTPNLGQGAGQALEDALVLARHLSQSAVPAAVAGYAAARRRRVTRLHRRSRILGQVGQMAHPALVGLRNAAMRSTPASLLARSVERVVAPGVQLAASSGS